MMRALTVFGALGLYVACVFVPPQGATHAKIPEKSSGFLAMIGEALGSETPKIPSVIPVHPISSFTQFAEGIQNANLKDELSHIVWAESKGDPRLCRDLMHFGQGIDNAAGTSLRDLLSLCLARTTGARRRCEDIDPSLRQPCLEGLDSNS
jgi:hypothetical protein